MHNTADFGLPQQRRRAWILCHLEDEVQCSAAALTLDVNRFQRCNVPLSACLESTQNPVTSGSLSRKSKRDITKEKKWEQGFAQQCEVYGKARYLLNPMVQTPHDFFNRGLHQVVLRFPNGTPGEASEACCRTQTAGGWMQR